MAFPEYPTDQLAFHYGFNETGINIYDSSPASRDAFIAETGIERVSSFTGIAGLSVSNTDLTSIGYITGATGSYGDVDRGSFSLSVWVYTKWTDCKDNTIICSKASDFYMPYFEFGIENDKWYCYCDYFSNNKTDIVYTQNTHDMVESRWYHITITVERKEYGNLARFYKNGVFYNHDIGRGSNPPYIARSLSNNGLFSVFKSFGANSINSGHFKLDDLWFFNNRLLSDADVQDLFKAME